MGAPDGRSAGANAWHPDSAPRVSADPLAQWLLTHGADFDVTQEEAAEHPEDFGQALRVRAPGCSGSWPVELAPRGAGDPNALSVPAPLRARSVPPRGQEAGPPPRLSVSAGTRALVAVIDDGINLVHARVRTGRHGSRVAAAWVQDGVHPGREGGASDLPFGCELTQTEIETALREAPNEEVALHRLDLLNPARPGPVSLDRAIAHGTHVLDLAAGAAPEDASAAALGVLAVQLPALVTLDSSGATLKPFLLAALAYVLDRARRLSASADRPLPLVINLSYGLLGAPDGDPWFAAAVTDLLARHEVDPRGGRVEMTLPSGNQNLTRAHASRDVIAGSTAEMTLTLRLLPDDRTPSYLDLWLPADATDIALALLPPDASRDPEAMARPIPRGTPAVLARSDGKGGIDPASVIASIRPSAEAQGRRLLLAFAPTLAPTPSRRSCPAGAWRVEVRAHCPSGGAIEAWVRRDDAPLGHRRRGRQPYLDDPAYLRFDARGAPQAYDPKPPGLVRRAGTLSDLGALSETWVVGGYRADGDRADCALYTATAGRARHPDLAAPSDGSHIRRGVRAAATRSGASTRLAGTSVAAPQVARMLAEDLAVAPELSRKALRAALHARIADFESRHGLTPLPRDRAGAGRLG